MTRHLLLTGGPTHPFAATAPLLAGLLAAQGVVTEVVEEPRALADALRAAEGGRSDPVDLVTVHALRWRMEQEAYADQRAEHAVEVDPADLAAVDRFVRHGGALLALHTAVICFDADPVWHALCGASWSWERSSHPPLGLVEVRVTEDGARHEITQGIGSFTLEDEVYGALDQVDDLDPLLVSTHGGRDHPLLWARRVGDGRVVTDLLGHGPPAFEHPTHRQILARAAAWAVQGSRARSRPVMTTEMRHP